MKLGSTLLFVLVLSLAQVAAAAGERLPAPNWSRGAALAAAESDDARETLGRLYRLAREGRGSELLIETRSIAEGGGRPGPERDRILHSLAQALGDFEPGVVGPETLEYLARTRSAVRVSHEENPDMGVPLFNIRAAATGSLAEWARISKSALDLENPYASAESFIDFLAGEDAAALASRMRKARTHFDSSELEAIVLAAPTALRTPTVSVVLAELSPGLLGRPAVDDMLFDLLDHRELGGTAALVLGRSGNPETLYRLADLASGSDLLAAKRASLAIDAFLAAERDR